MALVLLLLFLYQVSIKKTGTKPQTNKQKATVTDNSYTVNTFSPDIDGCYRISSDVYFIVYSYFIEAEITFYQESTPNHNTVLAIKYTYILIGNFISSIHTKNIIPHIIYFLFIF